MLKTDLHRSLPGLLVLVRSLIHSSELEHSNSPSTTREEIQEVLPPSLLLLLGCLCHRVPDIYLCGNSGTGSGVC